MQRVFISNNEELSSADVKITNDFDIRNLSVTKNQKNGDTVFVIDVHCTFKDKEKMQQQGGADIYRHLLKQFDGCQDKLKVIFYSPLSAEELVSRMPENYVLRLLPFIELFPKEKNGNYINNWKFEAELQRIIKRNIFPQFNNASENLLSGWAVREEKKINTNGKKILFIDDQQSEWGIVFSKIFPRNTVHYIENSKGIRINTEEAFKNKLKTNFQGFIRDLKRTLKEKKPDLILSDFYLSEFHVITEWKDIETIESKSGYKVFRALRNLAPATPFVFHTSSNKAQIYKFFDARGVDDWIVKDVRNDSKEKEKGLSFREFKDCIEDFLSGDLHIQLKSLWRGIENIEKRKPYWWKSNFNNLRETIVGILKDNWFGLKRIARKQYLFEKAVYSKNYISNEDTFTAAAVIVSLNNILELLEFHILHEGSPRNSGLAKIVRSMRNVAGHGRKDFFCFSIQDAIFANYLILKLLQQVVKPDELKKTNPIPSYNLYPNNSDNSFKYALFWLYLQLYNSKYLDKHLSEHKSVIEERINNIFDLAKNDSGFINILNSEFSSIKRISPKVKARQLKKGRSGKFIIICKS